MKPVIFFVEDDINVHTLMLATLEKNNFTAQGFYEPLAFLKKLEISKPDLIVLDLMLPHMNGYEVLKVLKEREDLAEIPVIILSAKSAEEDIVLGLNMGASDYITKPFGLMEFVSRINANLRKVSMHQNKVLKIRGLSLDITRHQVHVDGQLLELTSKEFDILQLLMLSPSVVVTRQKMLKQIWGFEFMAETRTLDMHIKTVREKISRITPEIYIETIRGVGYIIEEKSK